MWYIGFPFPSCEEDGIPKRKKKDAKGLLNTEKLVHLAENAYGYQKNFQKQIAYSIIPWKRLLSHFLFLLLIASIH